MSSVYKCFCGPFWCPKCLRAILSKPFNPACRLHDIHYSKKIGRKKADKIFLSNMLRLNKREARSKVYDILAYVFYFSVRIGGWISYR